MTNEDLYLQVNNDLKNDKKDESVWMKALTLAEGDEQKAQYKYISLMVDKLSGQQIAIDGKYKKDKIQSGTENRTDDQNKISDEVLDKSYIEYPRSFWKALFSMWWIATYNSILIMLGIVIGTFVFGLVAVIPIIGWISFFIWKICVILIILVYLYMVFSTGFKGFKYGVPPGIGGFFGTASGIFTVYVLPPILLFSMKIVAIDSTLDWVIQQAKTYI